MKNAPKHIPKDILVKVLKLRNEMLIKPNSNKLSLGKLAYDVYNQEFGFVIGPIELERDDEDSVKRSLLVTLSDNGPRVRYTRLNNLVTYNDISEGVNDLDSVLRSDVFEFCNNLCIHECSDTCILHKYKL